MKEIIWTKYGPPDVLQLKEIERPAPKADEVLIKIYATTVTPGDCETRGLKLPIMYQLVMRLWRGLIKPGGTSILGTELAGEIEAVGVDVKRFNEGDQVLDLPVLVLVLMLNTYACRRHILWQQNQAI